MLHLYFYVEELSAEVALESLVPNILTGHDFEKTFFRFQGKSDMLKRLPALLKQPTYIHSDDSWRSIVLIDRDDRDCGELKNQLETIAHQAKLTTRTASPHQFQVINRIIIEELEAWFFGDIEAIVKAYPRINPNLGSQAGYRDPDAIRGGTWERLEALLKEDYHQGGLEKIRAAQEISKHMVPARNRSKSFQVFRDALLGLFQ